MVTSRTQSLPTGSERTRAHVATRRLLTSQVTPLERPSKYAEKDKSFDRISSCKLESKRVSCKQHISMPRRWMYKRKWDLLESDLRPRPFKLASLKSIMNITGVECLNWTWLWSGCRRSDSWNLRPYHLWWIRHEQDSRCPAGRLILQPYKGRGE